VAPDWKEVSNRRKGADVIKMLKERSYKQMKFEFKPYRLRVTQTTLKRLTKTIFKVKKVDRVA